MQCVKNTGPLPVNIYKLTHCQDMMHTTTVRPCSFVLTPQQPGKMCGRSDFLIHGCNCCEGGQSSPCDKSAPPCGTCSAGCVVIPVQERIKLRVGDYLIVKAQ